MWKLSLAVLILAAPCWAFEDLSATDSSAQLKLLQARLDSLEAQLEKIKMEPVNENPLATGEFLKWGQGLNFMFRGSGANILELEMNYNRLFDAKQWRFLYSGNTRYGLSAGVLRFEDERNFNTETGDFYITDGHAFFAGITADSPVLLNFISYSQFFGPMYITASERGGQERNNWGLKFRLGMEFWFNRQVSLTMGVEGQGDFANDNNDTAKGLLPWSLRTSFGTRFFFH
ncbi:MAG: hypothetical protein GKR89_17800 [Candidatus Latescibacteria bacterium]|nr:hypothetical protein [Candidatus Latescibacterota bacterium]